MNHITAGFNLIFAQVAAASNEKLVPFWIDYGPHPGREEIHKYLSSDQTVSRYSRWFSLQTFQITPKTADQKDRSNPIFSLFSRNL
jgi:hypothetical protein